MPIGNGDASSSVWVDGDTGDLRLLVSKSDVFDENSQPVKTGVLRLAFDPPLWKPSDPQQAGGAAGFQQTLDISTSTVTIKTATVDVTVHYDLNAPLRDGVPHRDAAILHVTAKSAGSASEGETAVGFGLKVTLEPYRKAGAKTTLGRGFCEPRFEQVRGLC